jgi:hypothetical protein
MSMFTTASAPCPACGTMKTFQLVASVNADRRPDLRGAILDGSFQEETCDKCGTAFVTPPALTYLDVGNGLYIIVQPLQIEEHWEASGAMARASFERAYGPGTNSAAQEIGSGLKLRVVFGWAGLREKLRCAEMDLDDVELELLKLALVRNVESSPLGDDTELRLLRANGTALRLGWLVSATERLVEEFEVPRSTYDEIATDHKAWQAMRDEMAAHPFVDMNRMLLAPVT